MILQELNILMQILLNAGQRPFFLQLGKVMSFKHSGNSLLMTNNICIIVIVHVNSKCFSNTIIRALLRHVVSLQSQNPLPLSLPGSSS